MRFTTVTNLMKLKLKRSIEYNLKRTQNIGNPMQQRQTLNIMESYAITSDLEH